MEYAAEGILLAAEHCNESEPVSLGSALEISLKKLMELIARLIGFDGKIVWDTSKPNGRLRQKLDTRRAEREFGFGPRVIFEEGFRSTIGRCQEHHK